MSCITRNRHKKLNKHEFTSHQLEIEMLELGPIPTHKWTMHALSVNNNSTMHEDINHSSDLPSFVTPRILQLQKFCNACASCMLECGLLNAK